MLQSLCAQFEVTGQVVRNTGVDMSSAVDENIILFKRILKIIIDELYDGSVKILEIEANSAAYSGMDIYEVEAISYKSLVFLNGMSLKIDIQTYPEAYKTYIQSLLNIIKADVPRSRRLAVHVFSKYSVRMSPNDFQSPLQFVKILLEKIIPVFRNNSNTNGNPYGFGTNILEAADEAVGCLQSLLQSTKWTVLISSQLTDFFKKCNDTLKRIGNFQCRDYLLRGATVSDLENIAAGSFACAVINGLEVFRPGCKVRSIQGKNGIIVSINRFDGNANVIFVECTKLIEKVDFADISVISREHVTEIPEFLLCSILELFCTCSDIYTKDINCIRNLFAFLSSSVLKLFQNRFISSEVFGESKLLANLISISKNPISPTVSNKSVGSLWSDMVARILESSCIQEAGFKSKIKCNSCMTLEFSTSAIKSRSETVIPAKKCTI